jgi:hypothetical protein
MSVYRKSISAMELSSTAAMMLMSKVVLVQLAISHVRTPTSAFLTPGFVMATLIVQEEKMRIKTAHLHHLVMGLNATTGAASHRVGYVMETEIVRMERMKIRTALLAVDLNALMVTVFLKAGYVMTMLTVPMMRLTVHAMGSNAKITDAAYRALGFAMET